MKARCTACGGLSTVIDKGRFKVYGSHMTVRGQCKMKDMRVPEELMVRG